MAAVLLGAFAGGVVVEFVALVLGDALAWRGRR